MACATTSRACHGACTLPCTILTLGFSKGERESSLLCSLKRTENPCMVACMTLSKASPSKAGSKLITLFYSTLVILAHVGCLQMATAATAAAAMAEARPAGAATPAAPPLPRGPASHPPAAAQPASPA